MYGGSDKTYSYMTGQVMYVHYGESDKTSIIGGLNTNCVCMVGQRSPFHI